MRIYTLYSILYRNYVEYRINRVTCTNEKIMDIVHVSNHIYLFNCRILLVKNIQDVSYEMSETGYVGEKMISQETIFFSYV